MSPEGYHAAALVLSSVLVTEKISPRDALIRALNLNQYLREDSRPAIFESLVAFDMVQNGASLAYRGEQIGRVAGEKTVQLSVGGELGSPLDITVGLPLEEHQLILGINFLAELKRVDGVSSRLFSSLQPRVQA
jgi:hypothetical protein